jgi:hypothetical protein
LGSTRYVGSVRASTALRQSRGEEKLQECDTLHLLPTHLSPVQISKLLIIPFVVLVEAVWLKKRFTIPVIFCVLTVILGVGIV